MARLAFVVLIGCSMAVAFGQTRGAPVGSAPRAGPAVGGARPTGIVSSPIRPGAPLITPIIGNQSPLRIGGGFGPTRLGGLQNRGPRTVVVPYPVYVGGYYPGLGYDTPPPTYGYQPQVGYGYDQPSSSPPVVIINQNFSPERANPLMRDYSQTQLPAAPPLLPQDATQPNKQATAPTADTSDDRTIYLIAFKDQKILPALAYWVEGDTLFYITLQSDRNQATLDLVDRDLSKRLNNERGLDFRLPAAKQ